MKKGFYIALGTPLNEDFSFCEEGMITQVEQQIEADASGLLVMGSGHEQHSPTGDGDYKQRINY